MSSTTPGAESSKFKHSVSGHRLEIEAFLIEKIGPGRVDGSIPHDEDLLAADLIDSLGITELVGFLEEKYGITVGDDDLTADNFRSIDAIASYVERRGG